MSQKRIIEVREQMFHLERRIKPLEWDASRNQINEFKKQELQRLKELHVSLLNELNELNESDQ